MKKSSKKSTPISPPSSIQILHAMLDPEADIRGRLAVVESHLGALTAAGYNDGPIEDQAQLLLADADADGSINPEGWTRHMKDVIARVERIRMDEKAQHLDKDDIAAVSSYGYLIAGSAFALGLAAGMRIGGAR